MHAHDRVRTADATGAEQERRRSRSPGEAARHRLGPGAIVDGVERIVLVRIGESRDLDGRLPLASRRLRGGGRVEGDAVVAPSAREIARVVPDVELAARLLLAHPVAVVVGQGRGIAHGVDRDRVARRVAEGVAERGVLEGAPETLDLAVDLGEDRDPFGVGTRRRAHVAIDADRRHRPKPRAAIRRAIDPVERAVGLAVDVRRCWRGVHAIVHGTRERVERDARRAPAHQSAHARQRGERLREGLGSMGRQGRGGDDDDGRGRGRRDRDGRGIAVLPASRGRATEGEGNGQDVSGSPAATTGPRDLEPLGSSQGFTSKCCAPTSSRQSTAPLDAAPCPRPTARPCERKRFSRVTRATCSEVASRDELVPASTT